MFFQPFPLPVPPIFPNCEVTITDLGARENELCTKEIADAIAHIHACGGVAVRSGDVFHCFLFLSVPAVGTKFALR